MKKIFIFLFTGIFFVNMNSCKAQINTFPYKQNFENYFQNYSINSGVAYNVNIYNHMYASPVSTASLGGNSRIHHDTLNAYSGLYALACLPTSNTQDTIDCYIDMQHRKNGKISFWAASDSNYSLAGGTRPAVAFISFSIDNGITFDDTQLIGDSTTFSRIQPKQYAKYNYNLPTSFDGIKKCVCRIIVSRGEGVNTAARFLIDDLEINSESSITNLQENNLISNAHLHIENNKLFVLKMPINKSFQITIFSNNGQKILEKNIGNCININDGIDIQNLISGNYFCIITTNKVSKTLQFNK